MLVCLDKIPRCLDESYTVWMDPALSGQETFRFTAGLLHHQTASCIIVY